MENPLPLNRPSRPSAGRSRWLVAAACVALVAAWRWLWCPLPVAVEFAARAGYWFTAATLGVLVFFALRDLVRAWRGWNALRSHWAGALAVLAGALCLQLGEPHTQKVLYDEYILGAIAGEMHFARRAAAPIKLHAVDGELVAAEAIVDKRPPAFPFLVAIAHDVTGYDPANAWRVNALLAALLLAVVYATGVTWAGPPGGVAGVLLLAGLPLLAQNATGGGFELLNLLLLAVAFLGAVRYLSGRNGLELPVFAVLALAYTRYESLIFLLAVPALLVVRTLRRNEAGENSGLSWPVALSPLLLVVPLALQQVYFGYDIFFQTARENFLAWRHVPDNLAHAAYFLFHMGRELPNSWLLSVAGALGFATTLAAFAVNVRAFRRWTAADAALAVFLPLVLSVAVVQMGLAWGQWDDPAITRYALPLLLAFAWCAMRLCGSVRAGAPLWILPALAAANLALVALPSQFEARATARLYPRVLHDWGRAWIAENGGNDTLIIAHSAYPFVTWRQPVMLDAEAWRDPARVLRALETGRYRQALIFQGVRRDSRNGPAVPLDLTVPPGWGTEIAASAPMPPRMEGRFLRVLGYTPPAGAVPVPPPPDLAAILPLAPAGTDAETRKAALAELP